MKKKITKIWGIGLVVVLMVSLLSFAAPVSASTLGWGSEVLPSTAGEVLEACDVTDFGVSADGTIWAGGNSTLLYKSTDTGLTWTASTPKPATSVSLVAVAPDNSDVVAYWSTANTSVFVTVNGGTTWGDLGTPKEGTPGAAAIAIYDIAISAESAGTNYVAVAGIETGGNANVWYFNVGAAAPAWKETNDVTGFTAGDSAGAVAFSPNFASDQVMVAVTADASAETVHFQMFSMNQVLWNDPTFASYPVSVLASIASPAFTGLDSASISLAPDYLGSDDVTRISFVGLALAGDTTSEGIYRLKDVATPKQISASEPIHSVAFNGTNLVAGRYDNNRVRYSDDPLATTPTFTSSAALKSPGLNTSVDEKVVVAWTGADVVAGTTGDDSAFAVSTDNGKSFNDISLIDTLLTEIEDVAVSADGSNIYFLSNDAGNDTSLWRLTDSWQRVLVIDNNEDFIVRTAPDDPDVVYVADTGSGAQTIYFSTNGGADKWFSRTFRYSDGIQDMAVEGDGDVAYVALYGKATVSTTTNSGFTWASAKSTKLAGGTSYTITSVAEDQLLVGSTLGYVSYSTDGNSSWTKLSKIIETGATNLQVTASSLDSGGFIYAASGTAASNFRRWEIDTSTSWSDIISGTLATGYSAFGIGLSDAGTMYVLASDGTDSSVYRALSPSSATSGTTWSTKSTLAADNVSVSVTPSALRISSGSFKLWSVATFDTGGTPVAKVYSLLDTISEAGPTLSSPADGKDIPMNPVSGKAYDVTFTWERPSSYVTAYDLQVALDADFTEVAKTVAAYDPAGDPSTVSKIVGPGDASLEYMPGTTYYWRVRVSSAGPIYSPYSEVRSFMIAELEVTAPVEIIIPPPAPAPQVVIPEIVIPEIVIPPAPLAPAVVIPPAPAPPAPITPAYIWAVIIIGAVLVIAVIVLIVRTRRPV